MRVSRIAALALMSLFAVLLTFGPAQAAGPVATSEEDSVIDVKGKLVDTREKPPAPVEGVEISVEDDAGEVVGTATSDADGLFSIPLGEDIDVVGETYTIKLDEETLPEGTELRDPEQVELKRQVRISADISVTFPIGEGTTGTGLGVRALQLAVGGLVFSLLLAMAALGLSMIFGTTGLTNFAHGELITFGALVALFIDRLPGDITVGGTNITMVTAVAVALVISTLFGWTQDKVLWKPLRRRGTGLIAAMIVSIGLSIFLRNLYQYFAGAGNHNYSQWTSPAPWQIGQVSITPKDVGVIIFATLVLVIVTLAIQKTRLGKATRAVSDNPALAASSGINVDRVISVVWAVGAGLAGLSGVLLGMTQGFDYQVGFKILLLVFAAVVLGGLGTVWGAILGSFIIGIFIEVSTLFVPAELKFVGALLVLILALLFRPQGLLGRAERVG
ncbi:branched-chain amino acid ABC transporter permease [Nocardioides pakistanensis]